LVLLRVQTILLARFEKAGKRDCQFSSRFPYRYHSTIVQSPSPLVGSGI
jgi:hypothetical protein